MKLFSGLRHNIRAHNSIAASYEAEHIVYIDHEPSQEYWKNDPVYASFLAEALPRAAAAKPGFLRFVKAPLTLTG